MTTKQRDRVAVVRAAREAKRDALEGSVHRVVAAYIAHLGGKVIVSGPIEIQRWPYDATHNFRVAIHCTGRLPRAAAKRGKR